MRVTLTKRANLNTKHEDAGHPIENLSVTGEAAWLPEEGKSFLLELNEKLNGHDTLHTSTVQKVVERFEGGCIFRTENTEYQAIWAASQSNRQCERCGAVGVDIRDGIDPYQQEIHDVIENVTWCEPCFQSAADDV